MEENRVVEVLVGFFLDLVVFRDWFRWVFIFGFFEFVREGV